MRSALVNLERLDLKLIIMMCLTLGLAPFAPPHLYEKALMLLSGNLTRPIDIFDLLFHGAPWILLAMKLISMRRTPASDR